jgi:hypothetical protein
LDETKEIGLAAVEIGMLEIPEFCLGLGFENALLKMWDFVEAIHV